MAYLPSMESGGLEHLHDTPPHLFMPSPTFKYSSWTPYGSAVCPEYYDYFQGWCHPRRGYGYRGYDDYRDRREYYRPRGYGRRTVPPRWNYAGSAVCPEYYDYAADCRAVRVQVLM